MGTDTELITAAEKALDRRTADWKQACASLTEKNERISRLEEAIKQLERERGVRRITRIAFATGAFMALGGVVALLVFHPEITAENDAILNQVCGALVMLNTRTFRYFFPEA